MSEPSYCNCPAGVVAKAALCAGHHSFKDILFLIERERVSHPEALKLVSGAFSTAIDLYSQLDIGSIEKHAACAIDDVFHVVEMELQNPSTPLPESITATVDRVVKLFESTKDAPRYLCSSSGITGRA